MFLRKDIQALFLSSFKVLRQAYRSSNWNLGMNLLSGDDFRDLITSMLNPDMTKRPAADECLKHQFLRILNVGLKILRISKGPRAWEFHSRKFVFQIKYQQAALGNQPHNDLAMKERNEKDRDIVYQELKAGHTRLSFQFEISDWSKTNTFVLLRLIYQKAFFGDLRFAFWKFNKPWFADPCHIKTPLIFPLFGDSPQWALCTVEASTRYNGQASSWNPTRISTLQISEKRCALPWNNQKILPYWSNIIKSRLKTSKFISDRTRTLELKPKTKFIKSIKILWKESDYYARKKSGFLFKEKYDWL